MNFIGKITNLSIIQKILLVVAIPCVSLLFVSGLAIFDGISAIKTASEMRANHVVLQQLSNLIQETQLERGKSVVYLKSEGSVSVDSVREQRDKVDAELSSARKSIAGASEGLPIESLLESLSEFGKIRQSVDDNAPAGKIATRYTKIVRELLNFQKATAAYASAEVSAKIRSYLLLEAARENAGLLRANLSGILAADAPLATDKFQLILALKAGIDNNLASEALTLSMESASIVKAFAGSAHWREMDETFQTVLFLANEGAYGIEAQDFFATISKVVSDMGTVIKIESSSIGEKIELEADKNYRKVSTIFLGIFINISILISILFFAIRNVKKSLNEVLHNLSKASESIAVASNDLTDSSQHLAAGSQETAAALQETVSSMSQMGSMVSKTLEKSKSTKKSCQSVGDKIDEGNETIEQMISSMNSIQESNDKLEEINKVIGSISKQTNVINDIVFKTQLLAVNASIEAAKAGVHGKGFSVVADEVSKLAQLSGESSTMISSLLEESDEKVTSIISDVSRRVQRGMDTTNKVKAVFEEITSEMGGIKSQSDDMMHASEEQSLGIEQVTSAVTQIDEATQSNTVEAQTIEKYATKLQLESHSLENVSGSLQKLVFGNKKHLPFQKKQPPLTPDASNRESGAEDITNVTDIETYTKDASLADHDSFKPAANG